MSGSRGDPWDQRVRSQLIGKDLVSGLLVYEFPLSSLRKKYRLSLKNDMPPRDKMDNPNITMEEYMRLEEEKARRHGKVYNWETANYGKIWYDEAVYDLRSVETEFPSIVFNESYRLKKHSLVNLRMLLNLIKNLYVPFGISFDPKRYYKDGVCKRMLRRPSVLTKDLHMAYPFLNTPHQYLRFEGLQYTDADIVDFEMRLGGWTLAQSTSLICWLGLEVVHFWEEAGGYDIWGLVAPRPERQQVTTTSAPEATKDDPVAGEGALVVPAPVQIPQPPPPTAGPAQTIGQSLTRVEEDVHEIQGELGDQREILDSMACDFS
ncbi:hypothetical protein Tco_1016031 [Tanacetum coccineum]|uniref:Uncharacterized protein n=1 Tax=Tanacetum coccineum TaxID=301880 RepID=A0ABQ5FMH0_9ASTR